MLAVASVRADVATFVIREGRCTSQNRVTWDVPECLRVFVRLQYNLYNTSRASGHLSALPVKEVADGVELLSHRGRQGVVEQPERAVLSKYLLSRENLDPELNGSGRRYAPLAQHSSQDPYRSISGPIHTRLNIRAIKLATLLQRMIPPAGSQRYQVAFKIPRVTGHYRHQFLCPIYIREVLPNTLDASQPSITLCHCDVECSGVQKYTSSTDKHVPC
ncbi:hypothetical protein BKA63DRAFT_282915 [Paraphoma chrysanthemicola]|nr:hypothetical protein BKA63DRAFT_282915 [Paraphoma chrysanthemicola]